jgi:quinol monooxygenase YgiN
MVVFSLRIVTAPARHRQVIALVESLLGPTRVEPGCDNCRLYADADDMHTVTLVQEWSTQDALDRYLLSDARKSLIAAMEMSAIAPVVRFDTIVRREGLAAIEQALAGGAQAQR